MTDTPELSAAAEAQAERRLFALRDHVRDQYERLRAAQLSTSQGDSLSELSTYDNHPADIATETFQRSQDIGLLDSLQGRLDQVEAALAQLDAGQYGVCARCGWTIPSARLAAKPETIYCVPCARDYDDLFLDAGENPENP